MLSKKSTENFFMNKVIGSLHSGVEEGKSVYSNESRKSVLEQDIPAKADWVEFDQNIAPLEVQPIGQFNLSSRENTKHFVFSNFQVLHLSLLTGCFFLNPL